MKIDKDIAKIKEIKKYDLAEKSKTKIAIKIYTSVQLGPVTEFMSHAA